MVLTLPFGTAFPEAMLGGKSAAFAGAVLLSVTLTSVRDRLAPEVPEGWLRLADAAKALGMARQTVLHKVQSGELEAVQVNQGRRKGLRINVTAQQTGLFDEA